MEKMRKCNEFDFNIYFIVMYVKRCPHLNYFEIFTRISYASTLAIKLNFSLHLFCFKNISPIRKINYKLVLPTNRSYDIFLLL